MLRSEDVAQVAARVAVFVGEEDEFAPLDELRQKLAARQDATVEVIAGADHFFHFGGLWEIADRVAAQLERWRQ
jgi:alpha/beta superfamily hydrolase